MSKRKASKLSSQLDLSNHSTADIIGPPSQRYSCNICKETDSSQDLLQLCLCQNLVHQKCMARVIDDWIQSDKGSVQNGDNQKFSDQKPYMCLYCHGEVFYKTSKQLSCRSCTQICRQFKKWPFKSFFQLFFFFLGLSGLIFGILVRTGRYCLQIGLNKMTVSIMVIAMMIIACLMIIITLYFIFVDILTDRRKRVEKVYQRGRKSPRKVDSITVKRIS